MRKALLLCVVLLFCAGCLAETDGPVTFEEQGLPAEALGEWRCGDASEDCELELMSAEGRPDSVVVRLRYGNDKYMGTADVSRVPTAADIYVAYFPVLHVLSTSDQSENMPHVCAVFAIKGDELRLLDPRYGTPPGDNAVPSETFKEDLRRFGPEYASDPGYLTFKRGK